MHGDLCLSLIALSKCSKKNATFIDCDSFAHAKSNLYHDTTTKSIFGNIIRGRVIRNTRERFLYSYDEIKNSIVTISRNYYARDQIIAYCARKPILNRMQEQAKEAQIQILKEDILIDHIMPYLYPGFVGLTDELQSENWQHGDTEMTSFKSIVATIYYIELKNNIEHLIKNKDKELKKLLADYGKSETCTLEKFLLKCMIQERSEEKKSFLSNLSNFNTTK